METKTITLDGISYAVDQFSAGVQSAIGIYNTFQADLQKEQLAVMKTQAALQAVGNQIADAVKKELADKAAAAAATPETEVVPAAE
jgi:hypothetical protein